MIYVDEADGRDCNTASKKDILIKLFFSTLYISTFTVGGGLVIITFMKKKFVDELRWLDEQEMLDITAISQSAPGLIAVNASILVGWKMAGAAGMFLGVLGTIIPPMAIIIAISFVYDAFASNAYVAMALRGMQAGVAAIILDVAWSLGRSVLSVPSLMKIAVIIAAFVATFILKLNIMIVILAAAAVGIADMMLKRRSRGVRS